MKKGREHQNKTDSLFESFQNLAEAIPNMVWTCSPDGRTDYLNHAWFEFTGTSKSDNMGLGWSDMLHPDDREKTLALWHAAVAGQTETYEIEHRFKDANGLFRWFKSRGLAVRDQNGAVVKWFGTSTDIHEERTRHLDAEAEKSKLAQEIEARISLQQFREDVLAHLSHDLRNCLLGQKRVLEHVVSMIEDDQTKEILECLRQSGETALTTVSKLIDVNKYALAGQSLITERLNVANLIEQCMDSVRALAVNSGLRLHAEIEDDTIEVEGNEEALRRLLLNLLHNAIQFTPDGGKITVVLQRLDENLRLVVTDTGIGIAAEDQDNLFSRFWKGDMGRQYSIGKGFGLYLCRQISEAHCGQISCKSALQAGTSFEVLLPAVSLQ